MIPLISIWLRRFSLIFFLITTYLPGQASDIMGVDIYYECTGPCTYKIKHKKYFDCTSPVTAVPPNVPSAPPLNFIGTPANCNSTPLPTGPWVLIQYIEVTPVCPGLMTSCNVPGSPINGVREGYYERTYDFCSGGTVPCTKFNITWSSCCRNGAITSGAGGSIYTGSTLIDLTITPCNSSPTFLFKPIPYICPGQKKTFVQGASDPDGDSLSYKLIHCYNSQGVQVNYGPGYSYLQPMGNDWNVSLDPFTGEIELTPNPGGGPAVGVLCMEVEEWRNGVKIGSVVRDMQITVLSSCTSLNPDVPPIQDPTLSQMPIGSLGPRLVRGCIGVPLCFDLPVTSRGANLNYELIWNKARNRMPGAVFFDPSNSTIQDTIRGSAPLGRFCWTPTTLGTFLIDIFVVDDACPIPGSASATYMINVTQPLINSYITVQPLSNCNEVKLTAFPRTNIPSNFSTYSYNWQGNGNLQAPYNLNLQDSTLLHSYPRPSSYFIDLVLEDTFGCVHSFRDFTTLSTGVFADAGPDLTLCSGFQFLLGTPGIPGLDYTWSPQTGINDSTLAQPVFTLQNLNQGNVDTVDYTLHVQDSLGCETYDYVKVVINPSLQVRISPSQPSICRGDSITLTASGGTGYLWSTGDRTASIRYPFSQRTTLSVVSFDNGCSSQPEFVTIEINPGPDGDISGSFRVCEGESAVLLASGASTFSWSVTPASPNLVTIANIRNDTTVWMVPSDASGCVGDTIFATVKNYSKPQADFSPTVVCQGVASEFKDKTYLSGVKVVSWDWDFGDGTTSALSNPTHTYSAAGTYQVHLTIKSENGCISHIQKAVAVTELPKADFDFIHVCQGSPSVFTNQSTIQAPGAISDLTWKYGDGKRGAGYLTTHLYDTSGFYNTTLIVTSAAGCVDSFTQTIFIHALPVADFNVTNACQDGVVFSFNGSSVRGGLDQISSYAWDFGDPGSLGNNFSSEKEPRHMYDHTGKKTVTLTVTTGNGCAHISTQSITVFEKPKADFDIMGHCELDEIRFIDVSQVSNITPINNWTWDFGNGRRASSASPATDYRNLGPGSYTVKLTVTSSEGCFDSTSKNITIDPNPRASLLAHNACPEDTIRFKDQSTIAYTDIAQWAWDFGGAGRGPHGIQHPNFVYRNPGSYYAKLEVTSDKGCTGSAGRRLRVYEYPQMPDLTQDTVCFSDPAYLIAAVSSNFSVNWYESLETPDAFHTGYAYVTKPLPSNRTFYVISTSEFGCESEKLPITATVRTAEDLLIHPGNSIVEMPLAMVEFTPVSNAELVAWSWDFGDGYTSDLEVPVHEFAQPGRMEVLLKAETREGCEISASVIIEVKKIIRAYTPSAFSPNGDGINDHFYIGKYNLDRFQIKIFSRWGMTIYESDDPNFRWNGKGEKGEDVPEGIYIYVIRYQGIDGNVEEMTGTITLIR